MKITVIGEANIDIFVQPHCDDTANVPPKTCTPGHIRFHHGGVARNIAHNLCLLGHEVQLMTVFGDDEFAKRLIEDCKNIGMNLSLSTQFMETISPIFLSFIDATGNMQSAVSDIELNTRMDKDWLKNKINEINHSDLVVADTLLSAEALTYLIDHCDAPLYLDAVSPKRALHIAEALEKSKKKSFFAMKCNRLESLALSETNDVTEAAKQLNSKGIQEVFVTLGEEGVIYGNDEKTYHFPSLPAKVINVTGSGDAFLAGVVHAHTIGLFGGESLKVALKMAQMNTESEAPVNPMLRNSLFLSY